MFRKFKRSVTRTLMHYHRDDAGIELIEFVVGGTLAITIMVLALLALWNTTQARASATNSIITTNVPTTAQQ